MLIVNPNKVITTSRYFKEKKPKLTGIQLSDTLYNGQLYNGGQAVC